MSRIIAFASGKGGTGKTTVIANVAVAGSQLDKDVGVLDADIPMANIALTLGLGEQHTTLHEVLAGESDLSEAIYIGAEGVKAVPSGMSLNGVRKADPEGMKDVVKELSDEVEILLIDCPSGLGEETLLALQLAEELVLVVMPEITSLSDALKTKIIAKRFGVKTTGVIISRASEDEELDVAKEEVKSMLEAPILGVVPEDPEIRKSITYGEPVVVRKPKSPSGKAIRKIASELFRD